MLVGSKLVSFRPSKPAPNSISGVLQDPKLPILALDAVAAGDGRLPVVGDGEAANVLARAAVVLTAATEAPELVPLITLP